MTEKYEARGASSQGAVEAAAWQMGTRETEKGKKEKEMVMKGKSLKQVLFRTSWNFYTLYHVHLGYVLCGSFLVIYSTANHYGFIKSFCIFMLACDFYVKNKF